jgi:16S rRNA (guanine(966)-N(2))-methyltransferase RsmD
LRIISGKYRGRVLKPPARLPVRPTTDFAKTGLFNILESRFDLEKFTCLDLFSGTGSISLELISRGCRHVTSVDADSGCTHFLKTTSAQLGINNISVIRTDAVQFLKKASLKFDLIFADPPFDHHLQETIHSLVFEKSILNRNGILILEHIHKENYDVLKGFAFKRRYGNITFSFFSNLESQILTPL